MFAQAQPTIIILTLTLISGFCDSLGFEIGRAHV